MWLRTQYDWLWMPCMYYVLLFIAYLCISNIIFIRWICTSFNTGCSWTFWLLIIINDCSFGFSSYFAYFFCFIACGVLYLAILEVKIPKCVRKQHLNATLFFSIGVRLYRNKHNIRYTEVRWLPLLCDNLLYKLPRLR